MHRYFFLRKNLFVKYYLKGVESERNAIIAALDSGIKGELQDDPLPGDVLTVAEVLLLFLNSMSHPIVPYRSVITKRFKIFKI